MPQNLSETETELKRLNEELKRKLAKREELGERWKEEAMGYRSLAVAMVEGNISHEKAKKILAVTDPSELEELQDIF